MFSVPLSLTSDTCFELPSYLHEIGADNAWSHVYTAGRDIHSYLSAPRYDNDGRLWVADTPFGRIFRITPTGEWDLILKYDGWPSGLCFHRDGRLLIADARHGILSLDIDLRKLSPICTHHLGQRFLGVTDLCLAANGDLYFSDAGQSGLHQPDGAVYCLKAEAGEFGALQQLIRDIAYPAGMVLSNDGGTLFVAATHDNAVWRLPLIGGGTTRVSRFIQLSGGVGPMGLALDHDDNLYVAHSGLGCVWGFDRRGEPKYRIDSSRGDITNALTIDAHDPRVIIITEAQTGVILKASLPLY